MSKISMTIKKGSDMDITAFVSANREKAFLTGDHSSYRLQLSRQLLSQRRKLGRTTPKNHKFTSKKPVTAEDIVADHGFVRLQVLVAERAWAHAMAMKSVHQDEVNQGTQKGSARRHILSRLHKAAHHAQNLLDLLQDGRFSLEHDTVLLEARAYATTMSGIHEFEKQSTRKHDSHDSPWQKTLALFSEAHVIHAALLYSTKNDLYKDFLSTNIDPTIRFAAYQTGISRSIPVDIVAKQHFPKHDKALSNQIIGLHPDALNEKPTNDSSLQTLANIPSNIQWRGRSAPLLDASIGQALASTQLAADNLNSSYDKSTNSKALGAAYDPVLTAAQDTVDAVRRAINEFTKEGVEESDSRMQNLRVADLATNYTLISWRIGRNRVLISPRDDGLTFNPEPPRPARTKASPSTPKKESKAHKLARLSSRIVLYDATIQSLDSISDLRGAARDTAFMAEIASARSYFRALRVLNIAFSHLALAHHREALALLSHASTLINTASSDAPDSAGPPTLALSASRIEHAASTLALLTTRQHGLVALRALQANDVSPTSSAPLINNLNAFPPGGRVDLRNIVAVPPRREPVPVAPTFLDLAWNYIDYPGRAVQKDVKADRGTVQQPQQGKKGWFGFGRS